MVASDLIKPELPFAAGVCVVAGETMALGRVPEATPAVLGFIVGFFISGSAMVSNDYFDLEVDKINQPSRPLPSGRATVREVVLLTIILSFIGLLAAAFIGLPELILAMITWTVGMLYNWKYKSTGLPGNMMVAFSVSITFIFGGLAAENLNGMVLTFGALAFIFDLSEEIVNGVLDAEGDAKRSSRSIARVYGRNTAIVLSGALFALFIAITIVPYLIGWLGPVYLGMVSCVDIAVMGLFAQLIKKKNTLEEERKIVRLLYLTMLLFIIAFLIIAAV
jgi:geranylgeranylglycerol-phosphate geranylgeranyltransferase